MASKFSAISLFSGAGGMDVGFTAAGFDVQWANDIDRNACETYADNHSGVIRCGDLQDWWHELDEFYNPALVFGGPPCQGFSVAGKMDPNDSRNSLMARYFDVVEKTQPSAFVCENVKGLAALSRWADFRQQLFRRIDLLGYHHALLVLNAADFGVPQARERMFLVGFRKKEHSLAGIDLHRSLSLMLEEHRAEPPVMADLLRRLGRAGSKTNSRVCNAIVTYAKNPVLRASPYAGMLFNGAGRPIKPLGHSATLAASMGGNKTPIVDEDEIYDGKTSFVERYHRCLMKGDAPRTTKVPKRLRRLTIDECMAIQTFPPDYKLAGRQSAMYRQIGNAVPCDLAKVVASVVKEVLENNVESLHDVESSTESHKQARGVDLGQL